METVYWFGNKGDNCLAIGIADKKVAKVWGAWFICNSYTFVLLFVFPAHHTWSLVALWVYLFSNIIKTRSRQPFLLICMGTKLCFTQAYVQCVYCNELFQL